MARSPETLDGTARAEYLQALEELRLAAAGLAEMGRRVERSSRLSLDHLEAGGSVTDVPAVIGLTGLRSELDDALLRFNEARMTTRVMTAELAAQEGTSLSEVARRFGFSRQYLSKLLQTNDASTER